LRGTAIAVCPFCKKEMRLRRLEADGWIEQGERPPFHLLKGKKLLCPRKFGWA
jgi:hypothetical protein